jgi:type II secretory pathway component PulJ
MSGRPSRRRGFLLLELVVGLTITALIVATAIGALRLLSRGWVERGQPLAAAAETGRLLGLMGETIARAVPLRLSLEDRPILAFDGTATRLRLVVVPAVERGDGRLELAELRLVTSETGATRLVWRTLPLGDGAVDLARLDAVPAQPLVTLPTAARFAYLPPTDAGSRLWRPIWQAEATLPAAVRLEADGAPLLLTELRAAAGGCAGDGEAAQC